MYAAVKFLNVPLIFLYLKMEMVVDWRVGCEFLLWFLNYSYDSPSDHKERRHIPCLKSNHVFLLFVLLIFASYEMTKFILLRLTASYTKVSPTASYIKVSHTASYRNEFYLTICSRFCK